MIVPAIIIAVAVLFVYARLRLVGSFLGLVLAHTVLALPYVVINVTASLRTFDIDLEKAAMSLGANRFQAFTKITLPLIRPGVFAGALFAFVISWDELVVALFVSGTKAITLPRRMWISLRQDIDPTIASIATLLVVFASVVLLVVELLRRRTNT
jgi:putative spermidine/putrescine transport system permease protein